MVSASLARRLTVFLIPFFASVAFGQVFSNATLNGKYFARHLEFTTNATNGSTDARSIVGTITFNGGGNYSFTGQQVINTSPVVAFSVSGTYSVSPGGNVTLTNPQKAALNINARYGVEAILGASTEASDTTFDFFVAIPAPAGSQTNATVGAGWQAADFELTSGSTNQVRDSLVSMALDGAGNVSSLSLSGHAANFNNGAPVSQSVVGATYNVTADGSGTIAFPLPNGVSGSGPMLAAAQRTLYVSKSGNLMLAATPGAHDVFIAVRNATGTVALTNAQRFWNAGIRVDSTGSSDDYAGSSTVILADASVIGTRRLHETGATAFNVTTASLYTVGLDGTGSIGATKVAVEPGGLVGANNGNAQDPTGYELAFGIALPAVTGTGVFVNPQGIVNAASNAPAGDAISPGEFIVIYGSGLAPGIAQATALPFPPSLSGVSVSIGGKPAPLYFVSPGQIDCIVPYATTGPTTTITVTNGSVSNSVTVNVALTSPGVFTADGSGTGDGSITHADGSLVNAASPAKKGETVVMYVSGLGALTNPVADGAGATAINNATTQMTLYVAGIPVPATSVFYQGLTVDAGLYQINFTVPPSLTISGELPLAILTPDAFTDEVNIAVQ